MKALNALILTFLLCSCANQVVDVKKPIANKYAPNGADMYGTVKYDKSALASYIVEDNRNRAYKRMYDNCGGEYIILSEGDQSKGQSYGYNSYTNSYQSYSNGTWGYFNYKCKNKNKISSAQ